VLDTYRALVTHQLRTDLFPEPLFAFQDISGICNFPRHFLCVCRPMGRRVCSYDWTNKKPPRGCPQAGGAGPPTEPHQRDEAAPGVGHREHSRLR